MQEPVISTSDIYAFSEDYLKAIKNALIKNKEIKNIHFVIKTNNINLKLKNTNLYEKYFTYDVMTTVELVRLKDKYKDIDQLSFKVMEKLFRKYKEGIVIH